MAYKHALLFDENIGDIVYNSVVNIMYSTDYIEKYGVLVVDDVFKFTYEEYKDYFLEFYNIKTEEDFISFFRDYIFCFDGDKKPPQIIGTFENKYDNYDCKYRTYLIIRYRNHLFLYNEKELYRLKIWHEQPSDLNMALNLCDKGDKDVGVTKDKNDIVLKQDGKVILETLQLYRQVLCPIET